MVEPRVRLVPEYASSLGDEAIELAKKCGLELDDWQQLVVRDALGVLDDGFTFASFQVGCVVPRQNGKGGIIEAIELAALFLLEDKLVIHSAHQFDTSFEAFIRMETLLEANAEISSQVKSIYRAPGKEGLTLRTGQRLRYKARTRGGGRGFTCDRLIYDEAMELPEAVIGATIPTLSTRPRPQVYYFGSAVDHHVHLNGHALTRLRARATAGEPRIAYSEWGVDVETPDEVTEEMLGDVEIAKATNPAFGIRITEDFLKDERASMSPRTYAVERLGAWDPPSLEEALGVFDPERWNDLADPESTIAKGLWFGFDVGPARESGTIVACGIRPDGLPHVEIIDRRAGTGWIAARLGELVETHKPNGVICDERGPAATILPDLERAGIEVRVTNSTELARACGAFYDAYEQGRLRHRGQAELAGAVFNAAQRPIGDSWAWARKLSALDISPLVAATLGLWGVLSEVPKNQIVAVAFA
jgi:hypothetical protein